MTKKTRARYKSPLLLVLIFLILSFSCNTNSKKPVAMVTNFSTNKVHIAFAGGGWRAHTGHAGWIVSLLNSNKNLKETFVNVGTISSNSGGSWFSTMMALSPKFVKDIEAKNAFTNWGNNGEGWLGTQHELFKNAPKICDYGVDIDAFSICVLDHYAGSIKDWANIVQKVVYKDYSLGRMTLSGVRQPWAEDKTLLLAASMLKSNVVLNYDGPGYLTDHIQFYQACHSPSSPELFEILDYGAKCSGSKPYYEVSPITFSGTVNGLVKPPFFPSLKTNEAFNLLYSELSFDDPDTANATITNPINNENIPAVLAATASSAAIGFEAYVRSGEILDVWELAYKARNLAPSFSLENSTIRFVPNANKLSAKDLAKQKIIRIADGGPVDNSGVAQLVSFLQQNKQADDFNIIAFDNVTRSFPFSNSSITSKAKVGVDIANLFGKGLCDNDQFCVFDCDDSINYCIEVPSLQIFEANTLLNTVETWSAKSGEMELIYTQYKVTTVENSTFGITKKTSGTLHAFTCVVPNAGTIPMDRKFKGYYEMFNFINQSLHASDGKGLKFLETAFGL